MCIHFFFTHKTWLSTDTWKRIEERKTIKSKIINTKSKRIQERLQLEYSNKENGIKEAPGRTGEHIWAMMQCVWKWLQKDAK